MIYNFFFKFKFKLIFGKIKNKGILKTDCKKIFLLF